MTISNNGTAYTIDGNGPYLVLVHGMGLNKDMWQWILPVLETRFCTIRYDLLGHGESPAPTDVCHLNELVVQIEELRAHIGCEKIAVIGFSLGGTLALAYGATHPDKTSAIVVLNSAHRRDESQKEAMAKRLILSEETGPAGTVEMAIERWFTPDFQNSQPNITNLVRKWMLSNDPKHYATIYRILTEGDEAVLPNGQALSNSISEIQCPTLVLTGENDVNNTPEMADLMANSIPRGRSITIPVLRHMGLVEDPDAFNIEIVSFLNSTLISN